MNTPADEIECWARWAVAEADRIDPVRNGWFLKRLTVAFGPWVRRTDFNGEPATATNRRGAPRVAIEMIQQTHTLLEAHGGHPWNASAMNPLWPGFFESGEEILRR
jgi:hypothetical protein